MYALEAFLLTHLLGEGNIGDLDGKVYLTVKNVQAIAEQMFEVVINRKT